MKKITYLGTLNWEKHTEDAYILEALKKEAEVTFFTIENMKLEEVVKSANKSDLFLFHGMIGEGLDNMTLSLFIERMKVILAEIKTKKVLWSLEKVWKQKAQVLMGLINSVDYVFVSDETWYRWFDCDKIFSLHPACQLNPKEGSLKTEYQCDIAFIGSISEGREVMFEALKSKFGDKFKVFDNLTDEQYADVCKSAKVIIVPQVPFDDYFWSERIYKILGYGGFCLHPRTVGLEEEGFVDGEHYATYYSEPEMLSMARILSDQESDKDREEISKNGRKFVLECLTYEQRVAEMIDKVTNTISL